MRLDDHSKDLAAVLRRVGYSPAWEESGSFPSGLEEAVLLMQKSMKPCRKYSEFSINRGPSENTLSTVLARTSFE